MLNPKKLVPSGEIGSKVPKIGVLLYHVKTPERPVADEWFWPQSTLENAVSYHIWLRGLIITQIVPKNPMETSILVKLGVKGSSYTFSLTVAGNSLIKH